MKYTVLIFIFLVSVHHLRAQDRAARDKHLTQVQNEKRKKEKRVNLSEVIGVSFGYNKSIDSINNASDNGLSVKFLAGGRGYSGFGKIFYTEFNAGCNIGLNTNKYWIQRAFQTPITNFSKIGYGGAQFGLNLYLMPVIYETNKTALVIGPGIGLNSSIFPSVEIKNTADPGGYDYNGSFHIGICYGLKSEFFIGNTIGFYIDYQRFFTEQTVECQYESKTFNKVYYNCNSFSAGLILRLTHKASHTLVQLDEINKYNKSHQY